MTLRFLSVLPLFAAPSFCQQSVALSVAAPTQLSASFMGASQVTSLPAGPVANTGTVGAIAQGLGASGVELVWHAAASDVGIVVDMTLRFSSSGNQVGQATAQPVDFLMQVDVPPGLVRCELSRFVGGDVWASIPTTRIDLDDDGIVELSETTPVGFVETNRNVGAGPLAVRCTLAGQLVGPGLLEAQLRLRFTPGSTVAGVAVLGCGPIYEVRPRFDGGIDCTFQPAFLELGVAVFGLTPAPLLLGTEVGLPCLLWPSPDLVVLAPAWQTLTLPIPPAARPLQIFTQAVRVSGGPTLATSPGWVVHAL